MPKFHDFLNYVRNISDKLARATLFSADEVEYQKPRSREMRLGKRGGRLLWIGIITWSMPVRSKIADICAEASLSPTAILHDHGDLQNRGQEPVGKAWGARDEARDMQPGVTRKVGLEE